jgi:hypothetical protein
MKYKTLSLAAAALLASGSVGCSTRIADFTTLSTKNIIAKGVNVEALPKTRDVEGEDITFLGFGANLENAVDRALAKTPDGNLMINAVVYLEDKVIFAGFRVKGDVVKVPAGPAK